MTPLFWLTLPALATDGPPALVVVDARARNEGWVLEVADIVLEDALPVDVEPGETLHVLGPDGTVDLTPQSGEIWTVSGPEGELWMGLLDDDIRADVVQVRGPTDALEALARTLDAELVDHEGTHWLVREDILLDLPWVEEDAAFDLDAVDVVEVGTAVPEARKSRPPSVAERVQPAVVPVSTAPEHVVQPQHVARPTAHPTVEVALEFNDPSEHLTNDPEPPRAGAPAYVGVVQCGDQWTILDASGRYRTGLSCAPHDPACGGPGRTWALGTHREEALLFEGRTIIAKVLLNGDQLVCRPL
jgi:hypothetical protein